MLKNLFLLLLIIIPFLAAYGQPGKTLWRLSGETGVYQFRDIANSRFQSGLLRLEGSVDYSKKINISRWDFQLRIKPEFYNSHNVFSNLKFFFSGQYASKISRGNWGVSLDARRFYYFNEDEKFAFDLMNLNCFLLRSIHDQTNIMVNLNYAYRDVSNSFDQSLDAFAGEVKIVFPQFNLWNTGLGWYTEKFNIGEKNYIFLNNTKTKNSGWRYGPEISINLRRKSILSAVYRFLFHQSDITRQPSYEHQVRVLFGKLLSDRWAIFFLIDFYFNKFTFLDKTNLNLLYSPVDNESLINLKLDYDLNQNVSLYLKTGYTKENLLYSGFSTQGWQSLLGIQLKTK
jgi:hypothetical protein